MQPGSPGTVGQARRLLSPPRLNSVKVDTSYKGCQGRGLERGELGVHGAARLLFSPR